MREKEMLVMVDSERVEDKGVRAEEESVASARKARVAERTELVNIEETGGVEDD